MSPRRIAAILVFTAIELSLCATGRANQFTYQLFANPGFLGGTSLTGTVILDGSAGDPFTLDSAFDSVDSFDVTWSGVPIEWNLADLTNAGGSPVGFSGTLGDAALIPNSGGDGLFFETNVGGTNWVLELGFDGSTPAWAVGVLTSSGPITADVGEGWDLAVPTSVPLPPAWEMELAGALLLFAGRRIAIGASEAARRA